MKASKRFAISGLLIACVLIVFLPTLDHEFINYDDDVYVTGNPNVLGGLSLGGLRWAWTSTERSSNWHPVTWISHMLDVELFGLAAGAHHRTSVILHACNALLLFLALGGMTGRRRESALVALLFAIHPLHVESVAWVAERKDVLSALFFMLCLVCYASYARRPGPGSYGALLVLYALGLMAKPMLVTLPFVLLLLDHWPLRRMSVQSGRRLVLEKLPLILLAAASSAVTATVQHAGEAVGSIEQYPLWTRGANAVFSYASYLYKMFWPRGLAVFYPHPQAAISAPWLVTGLILLALASFFAWRARSTRPYFLVGWLWFVGMLVPVIGIVQVGEQGMADRYTYLPSIGLFIALAWGLGDLAGRRVAAAGAGIALLSLLVVARLQVGHWRNSETLFRHALEVTDANHTAHLNLALALLDRGQLDEAIVHLREAVRLAPEHFKARYNLAAALLNRGAASEAHEHLLRAVALDPREAEARYGLGLTFARMGRLGEAMESFCLAAELDPGHALAHAGCGELLVEHRRWDEAIAHLSRSVALEPRNAPAHYGLAVALYNRGRYAAAWKALRLAERHGQGSTAALIRLLQAKLPEPAR